MMALAEVITPLDKLRPREIIPRRENFNAHTKSEPIGMARRVVVENFSAHTKSEPIGMAGRVVVIADNGIRIHQRFSAKTASYSAAVRRNFLIGIALMLSSGIVSLIGVAFESDRTPVVAALLLAGGLFFLTRWIERAHVERSKNAG